MRYRQRSGTHQRLGVIWVAFAIIFGALASYHFVQSGLSAPDLHTAARGGVFIGGVPIDAPLADFSTQFNEYLHSQNAASRNQNLASAAGYVAALLTALFSAALEFFPRDHNPGTEANGHHREADDEPRKRVPSPEQGGESGHEARNAKSDQG